MKVIAIDRIAVQNLLTGHSMTNRHRRLTTTSPILIKIGVCGYLIAKTHW